jgi:hypothetical protein
MSYERQLIENLAAESDPRTVAIDYRWWDAISGNEARIVDEYTESGHWVAIRFEVCPLCEGHGKHVNPSIDAHGLSREDFDEDPDFAESYSRGDYDVRCTLCRGEKVVSVPLDAEVRETIEEHVRDLGQMRAEMLAEMRMGA